MSTQRKRYSAEFERSGRTGRRQRAQNQPRAVSLYGVHPSQITPWKHQLRQGMPASDVLGPTGHA